jgi:transcriptional regulator with XRE-family HTH domain
MKKLNLGKSIIQKRKEKGITQEKLAEYMGVSKAAVSKWESGQSYPDILLLPELATYFNISVDELLGYSPQMSREEIKKVYQEFSHDFAVKPFEEVIEACKQTIREYYACFPLLLAMIQLLLNHSMLAKIGCPDIHPGIQYPGNGSSTLFFFVRSGGSCKVNRINCFGIQVGSAVQSCHGSHGYTVFIIIGNCFFSFGDRSSEGFLDMGSIKSIIWNICSKTSNSNHSYLPPLLLLKTCKGQ